MPARSCPWSTRSTARFDVVRKAHPGYEISAHGTSRDCRAQLRHPYQRADLGLVGDIFLVFIFLGFALRSLLVGVSSILPSLFPIFATGALLYYTGQGLQFASIVATATVAFSLAIDSTIHFLNRYRLEEQRLADEAAARRGRRRKISAVRCRGRRGSSACRGSRARGIGPYGPSHWPGRHPRRPSCWPSAFGVTMLGRTCPRCASSASWRRLASFASLVGQLRHLAGDRRPVP